VPYQIDVFISYRRNGTVQSWVRNHFAPRLQQCLADNLDYEPEVFLDEQVETGVHWPHRLANALRHTRILVPVWSAQYFRSAWCLAEWRSMTERERLLGLCTPEQPQGLIYPIVFADSENFPDEARQRQARDLREWNVPDLQYQQTEAWIELHRQIRAIAIELAHLLPQVPAWRPDWPLVHPTPALTPPTPMPRF
jgi:hypothetical protein